MDRKQLRVEVVRAVPAAIESARSRGSSLGRRSDNIPSLSCTATLGVRRVRAGARQLLELCAWAEINLAQREMATYYLLCGSGDSCTPEIVDNHVAAKAFVAVQRIFHVQTGR
jgi:hypothetical protein